MAYAQLAQICAPHVEQMTPILRKGAGRIGFHVGVWPQIWMESTGCPINYSDVDAGEPVPQLGQLPAFIRQRIRHVYRRRRPTQLPSRMTESRNKSQLGIDGLDVAHARSVGPLAAGVTSPLRRRAVIKVFILQR
jgi:hypothetical protein